jgi:hypothetical protein
MAKTESPVAVAKRHVADAEMRVARQERLVATLERDKHAVMAQHGQRILEVLKRSLELARVHLQLEIEHYGDEGIEPSRGRRNQP